jgi:hypothetical protein
MVVPLFGFARRVVMDPMVTGRTFARIATIKGVLVA